MTLIGKCSIETKENLSKKIQDRKFIFDPTCFHTQNTNCAVSFDNQKEILLAGLQEKHPLCGDDAFCWDSLRPSAVYTGIQRSEHHKYDVRVEIKETNFQESYMAGYLTIFNLTTDYPELTTFFEGEIIGRDHGFQTRKWDADQEIDKRHWSKFTEFAAYQNALIQDDFCYDSSKNNDCIFMRWKELFLVPDHRLKNIQGASFAGFYYVCCHPRKGFIEGYYYHKHSDLFQQVTLSLKQNNTFPAYSMA